MSDHGSPSLEQVRANVAAWIEANWDPALTVGEWWHRLADAGLSAPMLPVEWGGRGYARDLASAVVETIASASVIGPPANVGLILAAPTIIACGTEEQKRTFLPDILSGRSAWCQLFSEPGSGSDLASLSAKAERDGDEWVITGQKVWSTGARYADHAMLLARTQSTGSKHVGITWFAFPMDQPGVEVRPLREMTGHAVFSEVFLDGARVPHANVIGALHQGWSVAKTTLAIERASVGGGTATTSSAAPPGHLAGYLDRRAGDFIGPRKEAVTSHINANTFWRLVGFARARGLTGDPVIRQQFAHLWMLVELGRLNVMRARSGQALTGAEANIAKLAMSNIVRAARDLIGPIVGPDAMLLEEAVTNGLAGVITLHSPAPSIYGGTDQIQRNIIGERALGLPRDQLT